MKNKKYGIEVAICWTNRTWTLLPVIIVNCRSEKEAQKQVISEVEKRDYSHFLEQPVYFFVIDSYIY